MGAALDEVQAGRMFDTWLREEMDASAGCEWGREMPDDCPMEAEWRMRMYCCGFSVNLCGDHRLKWVTIAKGMQNPYCSECGEQPINVDKVIWTKI